MSSKLFKSKANILPWKEIQRISVFSKYGRSIEKVLFQLPDGEIKDFHIQQEKSTVCVFALTEEKEIVLIEQYRPGPQKVLQELPGGYIDDSENPLQAISREFQEETGYTGNFKILGHSFHSAYSTRTKYYFLATNCKKISNPLLLDTEKYSRVVLSSLTAFLDNLKSGDLTDADGAYAALNYIKNSQGSSLESYNFS